MTGYVIQLGGLLISWKSKKQHTVSRSSAKSEYRSMVAVVSEVIWLIAFLQDIGVNVPTPIELFCDNKAAIQIASNLMSHERTKHIEIDCHFVRERFQAGLIKPAYLSTTLQLADLLTEGLVVAQHHFLLSKLGVLDVFHAAA